MSHCTFNSNWSLPKYASFPERDFSRSRLNLAAFLSGCPFSVEATYSKFRLSQTWANYGPRAKSGPSVLLFWPAGTYTNLNSHSEFSGRPCFSFRNHEWQWLSKTKLQRFKIGIKNEVKTFYFGDHICTWTVISPKKGLLLVFQSACGQLLQQLFQIWLFMWNNCPPLG